MSKEFDAKLEKAKNTKAESFEHNGRIYVRKKVDSGLTVYKPKKET